MRTLGITLLLVLAPVLAFAQIAMPVTDTVNWNDAITTLLSGVQGKSYLVIAFAVVQVVTLVAKMVNIHKLLGKVHPLLEKWGSLAINFTLSATLAIIGLVVGGMDWVAAVVLFLGSPAFGKFINDVEKKSAERE